MTSDWSSTTKDGTRSWLRLRRARSRSSQRIDVEDDLGAAGRPRWMRGFDRDRRSTWARPSGIVGSSSIWSWMNLVEARRARAQIVHARAPRDGCARFERCVCALRVRQLAVHQHVERPATDLPGADQQVERHQAADAAVDQRLVEPAREDRCRRRGEVASRGRSCSAPCRRRWRPSRSRARHGAGMPPGRGSARSSSALIPMPTAPRDLVGMEQTPPTVSSSAPPEAAMKPACTRPASASALPWPKRWSASAGISAMTHGEERHQRAHEVERRVDQRRQHAHRIGDPPRRRLGDDQDERHRHRGYGGEPHQARGSSAIRASGIKRPRRPGLAGRGTADIPAGRAGGTRRPARTRSAAAAGGSPTSAAGVAPCR